MTEAKDPPKTTTVGVVIPKVRRKMKALTLADGLKGDRGLEDLCKWILNFWQEPNPSGHFNSLEALTDFVAAFRWQINTLAIESKQEKLGLKDLESVFEWIGLLGATAPPEMDFFDSEEACEDFLRQLKDYVENDEYIFIPLPGSSTNETSDASVKPLSSRKIDKGSKARSSKRRGGS